MKTLQSFLASTALLVSLGLAPALMPAPALAVDNMSSSDAPDLASVRAKIKAQDYAAALAELRDLGRGYPTGRCLQSARVHPAQDRRLQNLAHLLHQGAGTAARPQGCPRVPRRALCPNRQYGEGQGTARHPGETLPRRLRRARRPSESNQRQIGKQLKTEAGVHSPASL